MWGDVIKAREALLLQTPEAMRKKFRVDVRVKNEAIGHRPRRQNRHRRRAETGETYTEAYDTLVLSTGSSPVRPPIPGIDSPRIETLWTVPDTDRIRALVRSRA
jgi:NADPH-dependent 2,4-dienoyl-CoA reductase/sulfur reductase-like enzyme